MQECRYLHHSTRSNSAFLLVSILGTDTTTLVHSLLIKPDCRTIAGSIMISDSTRNSNEHDRLGSMMLGIGEEDGWAIKG